MVLAPASRTNFLLDAMLQVKIAKFLPLFLQLRVNVMDDIWLHIDGVRDPALFLWRLFRSLSDVFDKVGIRFVLGNCLFSLLVDKRCYLSGVHSLLLSSVKVIFGHFLDLLMQVTSRISLFLRLAVALIQSLLKVSDGCLLKCIARFILVGLDYQMRVFAVSLLPKT